MSTSLEHLASYHHCADRIVSSWPDFRSKRDARLVQQTRYGAAAEKVAENIVEDLVTEVLDWSLSDVNHQIEYADLLLTSLGIKRIIVETKRPGALAWRRTAVESALSQARRYAFEQRVGCIAVSDGLMLYAADIVDGGLRDRAFLRLDEDHPAVEELWWLSVQGIWRPRPDAESVSHRLDRPTDGGDPEAPEQTAEAPVHPKYHVPAECFAYVGSPSDPGTWKLPFRKTGGKIDGRRLPKAIQAILTNYRGAKVQTVPESAIPDVLLKLARGAVEVGKMPFQNGGHAAAAYEQLEEALRQLDRLAELDGGGD